MHISLLTALLACAPTRPQPAEGDEVASIPLDVGSPFAELELPPSVRPDGSEPPERIPVTGWRLVGTSSSDSATWEATLPIRLRSLFFTRPPEGMALVDDADATIPHVKAGGGEREWRFTRQTLRLDQPAGRGEPAGLSLRYPRATAREARLNLEASGLEPADFARATVLTEGTHHAGLLLPAPATAAFDLTVPPAAEFWLRPGLVAPEVADGPPSDGATLVVEVEAGGAVTEVLRRDLEVDAFPQARVDLSPWAGQGVRLRLRTEPGASADYDYAFVGQPVVASRRAAPRRLVWVFVDTLRADHLRAYGYHRDTAPALDALASQGVLFEQARSVAPWTLPAGRTLVTGRQPEHYGAAPTLQATLREAGWATKFLAGNVYLSANFEMHHGWGEHQVVNWPHAVDQVDDALAWLGEVAGRDAFLMVNFMDPHLPYQEPASYRRMFAGERPAVFSKGRFTRNEVYGKRSAIKEAEQQYLRDRYDQNVRYVNDEIARLLGALGEDDVVFYFSDHGEEFWDHTGFEHGHTLYDELLHVPLVVRAPGLEPGRRVAAPVSLLDLAPTALDLLDEAPLDGAEGASLVPAMAGEPAALAELAERPLAFGRPLYGAERWGVLTDGMKYTAHEGREALYDLGADPGETDNAFVDQPGDLGAPWRPHVSEALGAELALGYRLHATRTSTTPRHDLVAELTLPGGVRAAWVGRDYIGKADVSMEVEGETARVTWHKTSKYGLEAFVIPVAPVAEVTHALSLAVDHGDEHYDLTVNEVREAEPGKIRTPLARTRVGNRQLVLTWGISPVPVEGAEMKAYDDEVSGELEALGYIDSDMPSTLVDPNKRPRPTP